MQEAEIKGQKLIRIPEKEHYFYDAKSMIIYYLKRGENKLEKVSSEIKYDGKSSLYKASRIIPVKLREKKEEEKKKTRGGSLNKLMGAYIEEMTDMNSGFHMSKREPVSNETLESYRTSARHLKEYFEGFLPHELVISEEEKRALETQGLKYEDPWLLFVKHFQEKNPGFTMFNVTKHFKALCRYLHEIGVMPRKAKVYNPNAKKEDIARKKKRHRIYSPEEILRMDAVCNPDQRLALWLGYSMGFRLDDCVNLTWDRVMMTPKNAFIRFFGDENKTGFAGRVPISDTCMELLKERRSKTVSPFVFPLVSDPNEQMLSQGLKFEEVVRKSGVLYGSHHILRHTRLTEDFGDSNLDNALVMKIRRVSLAVALEHYIHPTDGDLEKFRNTAQAKRGSK